MGYLFFEMKSILENFEKLGIDTVLFKDFIEALKKYLKEKGEK